ncbi:MAG: DUF4169 family protein [Alphaproteobacteria bacterium]|nr:DUF4169 family protein [Alphaproteobacteria bacterium]
MADIVNLRTARKHKARAEKAATAEANRVKHGTSSKTRKLVADKKALDRHRLDGKKLED